MRPLLSYFVKHNKICYYKTVKYLQKITMDNIKKIAKELTSEEKTAGKKKAAIEAAEIVKEIAKGEKIILGVGSGSTVALFIEEIVKLVSEGLKIEAVSTSSGSTQLAKKWGIKASEDYNDPKLKIDVLVDGMDEIDEKTFEMIKGGGGAHTREEIVAGRSKLKIAIADPSKMVKHLGKFPLPVEVLKVNWKLVAEELLRKGYKNDLRKKEGKIFVTDQGNYILDLHLKIIKNPAKLKNEIKQILGVVSVGLFIGNLRPDVVFLGEKKIERKK